MRVGLLAVVIGLVVWRLSRPAPRGGGAAPLPERWQGRGLRLALLGLGVVWLGALVAIGALR